MTFLGRIKEYNAKNCTDLSKTTKITIMTEELVGKYLDDIPADCNVQITIEVA